MPPLRCTRLAAVAALALAAACGTARSVRPLGAGKSAIDLSLGGPLLGLSGAVFPMPVATLGATRGITDTVDAFGRVQLTSAVFGVAGLELGAGWMFLEQDGARPALSVAGAVMAEIGRGGLTLVPTGTLAASWLVCPRMLLYLGSAHGLSWGEELDGTRGVDGHWAPFAGVSHGTASGRWTYTFELRWHAPTVKNEPTTVDWRGIAGRGGLAPMIGVGYAFGGAP